MPDSNPIAYGSGRLRGLDPGRVMEWAMGPESRKPSPGSPFPVPSVTDLAPLLPEYEIEALIGRGGMGAVYRAVQRKLARRVAIKVLPVELGDEAGFADRFRREAMTTAGLVHPDIVAVYDTGETVAGHLYYVMEYVDGEDLAQRMARGGLPVEESIPLLATICGAVEAAHWQGIIHRDIKPSNILLTKEGRPRLADFGLARLTEKPLSMSRLTRGGTTLGTMEYAAPEQLAGSPISPASDLYSLGVLAYELLTGELPRGVFDPPSVRNPGIDPAFDGVVLRALQSDPARRYADAGEFCGALLQAADRRLQQANRERDLRRKAARRARVVAVLTGIALLTGGSAIYAWLARREANERRAAAVAAEAKTDHLIQFLLTDLRRRLEPTGNLGAMDSVLERAVVHYREKYKAAGHSPEAAVQLADVLVVKGDVIGVRGLGDEADVLYTEAIALTGSAWAASPREVALGLRVVAAWQDRSEHRMTRNQYEEALADARRMLEEARRVETLTTGPAAPRAVAAAHRAMANALGYLDQPDACQHEYEEAQRILRELLRNRAGDAVLTGELADLNMSLGSLAEGQGDYPRMLGHFTDWHDFVKQRYGSADPLYSYSAFRMGVAMVKCGRPAEAVSFLNDAIRLAEGMVAEQPGHKGSLNHLSWCLRMMAEALEASGAAGQAEVFRRRQAEANRLLAAVPVVEAVSAEQQFASLAAVETTHGEWWNFCQQLQARAERGTDLAVRRSFYETWIGRVAKAAHLRSGGDFMHTVEAFLHNRLAVQLLAAEAGAAAEHASQALHLRQAIAAAHPGDSSLERNVISSAGHLVRAAVRLESAPEAQAAFERFAAAARGLSPAALLEQDQALAYAAELAALLEYAADRWPEASRDFQRVGGMISSEWLDRLPADRQNSAIINLSNRLRGGAPGER